MVIMVFLLVVILQGMNNCGCLMEGFGFEWDSFTDTKPMEKAWKKGVDVWDSASTTLQDIDEEWSFV